MATQMIYSIRALYVCALSSSLRRNVLLRRLLATLLAGGLLLPAQQATPAASPKAPPAQAAPPAPVITGLKIVVISGEGASNQIRSRSPLPPPVEFPHHKYNP